MTNLESVASQPLGSKKLDKLAQTAAKNFKPTVASSLEKANDLAYWLYLAGKPDLALLVCQQLDAIAFTNNYNTWTWVELALALEARILKEQGNLQQAAQTVDKIKATFSAGDQVLQGIKAKALGRRLDGELLPFDKIAESEESGDADLANEYRFAAVKELVYIRELGGSSKLPVAQIETTLQDTMQKIKPL